MDNDDCDLFSILHSCKTTTFTSPTNIFDTLPSPQTITTTSTITKNIISPQNSTTSYFEDFSLPQENRSVCFSPLKPTDFVELDKLKINFNSTTTIPTTLATITTTSIPVPIYTTTTTTTYTIDHDFNQNYSFPYFPTLIEEQQMQQSDITCLEKTIPKFNPTTIIPIPTLNNLTTIPTTINTTPTTTTFTHPNLTTNICTPSSTTTTPFITTMINTNTDYNNPNLYKSPILLEQQQIQLNNKNEVPAPKPPACIEITAAHFDFAYNHPSIFKYPKESSQLPIIPTNASSSVLPNTDRQGEACKKRKSKFDNQKISEFHLHEDKVDEDPWEWRKYGQKPIKGSPHLRVYFICSTSKDCPAKKQVEEKPNKKNIRIVTYIGEHNHPRPAVDLNHILGCQKKKLLKKRLSNVKKHGSMTNIGNSGTSNAVMSQFDRPECSNARVNQRKSKVIYQENELTREVGSLPTRLELPYSETGFMGNFDDEDNILIPNLRAMSEDFPMDFNSGFIFP